MIRIGILSVLTAMLFLAISCSKEMSYEKPGGGTDTTTAGDFRALINNVQWVASPTMEGATIVGGIINLYGTSSDFKQITITLNGNSAGQYLMDQYSFNLLTYTDINSSNSNPFSTNQGKDTSLAGGTVSVTIIDTVHKTISGYFQCKVYRNSDNQQEVITQGSFTNIPYTTTLPPGALTDTLHVLVGGVEWVPPSRAAVINFGSLFVNGSASDGSRSLALVMPQTVQPGSYAFNFAQGKFIGEYSPDGQTILIADTTGTLVILENNTASRRIRGNFQFKAVDIIGGTNATAVLTQGYFSLSY